MAMTYEEFAKMYEQAMEDAIKMYSDTVDSDNESLTDNGMDDDCEAHIFSSNYITGS
jgi:hypothetical protein